MENAKLRSRVAAYEQELAQLRRSAVSVSTLDQQLVCPTTCVVGHTSSQRSKQSSATGVIFDGSNSSELQSLAPDLLKLFTTLGNTRRNMADGVQGVVPNDKGIGIHLHPPEL